MEGNTKNHGLFLLLYFVGLDRMQPKFINMPLSTEWSYATENKCQKILSFIYVNRVNPDNNNRWLFSTLKPHFEEIGVVVLEDIIAILYHDGFIDLYGQSNSTALPSQFAPMVYFSISYKGIAFFLTIVMKTAKGGNCYKQIC